MSNSNLQAVSPIDGRYHSKVKNLSKYFSEEALFKYRVKVEIEYFIHLAELPLPQLSAFPKDKFDTLRSIYTHFSTEDASRIKEIEKTTNHDVKAVEYFIKEAFDKEGLEAFKEFIHFGLTSQDINNTAVPASLQDAHSEVYISGLFGILATLQRQAEEWESIPLLARTHGQPASPTRLGKEIAVFCERLEKQLRLLEEFPFEGKFGGATGNFNAHHVAYPDFDWAEFGNSFLSEKLDLERQQTTTQIEHYDRMAEIFQAYARVNTILIDLCRDIWTYISMDYFKQQVVAGEIGSSAMPHKVNPIDFENAEGNFGLANSIFYHLAEKLPISRLQRDLTDSTVTRNIGVPFAHTMIGFQSLLKGLSKLLVNEEKIRADLNTNWAVVAEAIQTVLRREAYPNPYEKLKELTRHNEGVNEQTIAQFIDTLDVSDELKNELRKISPENYTGV